MPVFYCKVFGVSLFSIYLVRTYLGYNKRDKKTIAWAGFNNAKNILETFPWEAKVGLYSSDEK